MQKLLVIDDEEPMRRLLRINLSDAYEIIDTGDPEQGLALAMQNKPSAICWIFACRGSPVSNYAVPLLP